MREKPRLHGLSSRAKSASQDWLLLDSPGIAEIGSDLKIT